MIPLKDIKPFPCLPGATVVAVDPGEGSETPGGGAQGLSAYQVALANGFIGTEAQWLESLRGEPGAPGSPAEGGSISNPFVVYVRTDGDNLTGEIGNPSKPFGTAQGACSAIQDGTSGTYAMVLGVGSFGGITFTPSISLRLKSITGVGPSLSLLGGINAAGANGASGDPAGDINGTPGSSGIAVELRGDGSVDLGNVVVSGGVGGDGVQSIDQEFGGSGGSGGDAGELLLEGFTIGGIYANGGAGGHGAYGNTSIGNGGNGGTIASIKLYRCRFSDLQQASGAGGSGMMNGSNGNPTAPFEVIWCDYNNISNPSDQSGNSAANICHSVHRSVQGYASIVDSAYIP